MTLDPEPILFMQRLLSDLAPYTAIESIPVRVGRLERTDTEPPLILLETAGDIRDPGVAAFLPARISFTAYGRTEDEAILIYRVISDLLHRRGPVLIDGVGMWRAFDETGPQPREDPNTNWSARFGVMDLYMADKRIS